MDKLSAAVPPVAPSLLELRGIAKRFPGVTALGAVNLSVGPGEVVTLIGENARATALSGYPAECLYGR